MNILGVVFSFIYFLGLLFISQRLAFLSLEGRRKFVHILLGNWWFVVLALFDNAFYASIVPASFIVINYISLKRNKKGGLLSELERKDASSKSYGIVLYPVSMLLLVIISFLIFHDARIGGIGLLALSYGDGVAALAGKKLNFRPFFIWGNKKTLSGSIAMFLVTFATVGIYLYITKLQISIYRTIIASFAIALISTVVELITPFGIDNIMIPISAVTIYVFFFQ